MSRLLAVFVSAGLIFGCGQKEKSDDEGQREGPSGAIDQSGGGTNLPTAPQAVLDLFRDSSDTPPNKLSSGGLDCLDITKAVNVSNAVEPWPAGLKAFLASELAKFPEFGLVTGSVAGIFLAKNEMLSLPDLPENAVVAGIMCGIEGQKQGYVFINHKIYVTDRQAEGPLETFQTSRELVDPYVLSEQGDQALYTLIHEIFHAIDQAYFTDSKNGNMTQDRADIFSMAWTDQGASIDATADIFARRVAMSSRICSPKYFNLIPQGPSEIAAAYRQIAENTSFISPYAQSNLFEDFADTLATWYFKTVHDSGLVRSVYADDLTVTPIESSRVVYKFDTKQILKTSAKHKDKMCAMVDLVFADQKCLLD